MTSDTVFTWRIPIVDYRLFKRKPFQFVDVEALSQRKLAKAMAAFP